MPEQLRGTESSLKLETWSRELGSHPDRDFAEFILRGIIGFEAEALLKQRGGNTISVSKHPRVITGYLQEEVRVKRIVSIGTVAEARELGIAPSE